MTRLCIAAAIVLLVCHTAFAQDEAVLWQADFEQDLCGFITIDPEAELTQTTEPGRAHTGEGALEQWYVQRAHDPKDPAGGVPSALMVPIAEPFEAIQSIHLAARTKLPTALGITLTEGDDGPHYTQLIWCTGDQWQEYDLPLSAFQYDIGSTPDPDGELTSAKISGVVVVDLSVMFRSMGEEARFLYLPPPAEQTIWLDDIELRSTRPPAAAVEEGTVAIARYRMPLVGMAVVGGDEVTVQPDPDAEEDEAKGAPIKIGYTIPEGTAVALIHQITHNQLVGIETLELRARAGGAAMLLVGLEEQAEPGDENKRSYNATVTVQPSEEMQTLSIPISSFTIEEQHFDPNGKLDLGDVRMLIVVDLSTVAAGTQTKNVIWLDSLTGKKPVE